MYESDKKTERRILTAGKYVKWGSPSIVEAKVDLRPEPKIDTEWLPEPRWWGLPANSHRDQRERHYHCKTDWILCGLCIFLWGCFSFGFLFKKGSLIVMLSLKLITFLLQLPDAAVTDRIWCLLSWFMQIVWWRANRVNLEYMLERPPKLCCASTYLFWGSLTKITSAKSSPCRSGWLWIHILLS